MALFGLDDSPNACFRAISAGLGMIEDIARNRHHFQDIYGMSFGVGIGIRWSKVVVATVGQRMTAIGNPGNFASRIESATFRWQKVMLSPSQLKDRHIGNTGTYMLYAAVPNQDNGFCLSVRVKTPSLP